MTTNWQDPAAPTPPAASSGGQRPNKGKRFGIVATLLVVIAGLATAAGLVMVNRGNDDVADSAQYVVVDAAATTPVFEPRAARGNDPFFPLEIQLTSYQEEVESEIDEQFAQDQADAEPGESVERPAFDVAALDEAVKTGLYGGTEENTCDPERLISFLYANPDLGEAWAKVQGIEFSGIASYIRSLEVRVLAEPVNVLNHGYDFSTSSAYEIDTVLDAGTAVLVDSSGNVRTRCYCGNPIKPKPPQHRPPRCIVFGTYVLSEPGTGNRREGVPRDVVLTGREANLTAGGTWVEVSWGGDDDQQGWVPSHNLRKSYCPIPTTDRYCPGPGTTKVWQTPATTTAVGRVTGQVRMTDTSFEMFAPISPVGGLGTETIINDAMLIRFTQASSAQSSAWVKLSDLNQDANRCQRVRQCINTEGPVWDRAGGAPIPGADGVIWAEFSGHFAGDPATHTEIRLNNGTGAYAWIGLFYTPLPDERCEQPILECVEYADVYETSTQAPPDKLGLLTNTTVEVIGGPQDGRLQIRFHNGPEGWVDQAEFFDGYDNCEPYDVCAVAASTPGYTIYPDQGDVLNPAIPAPKVVQVLGQSIEMDGSAMVLIGIDGTPYWIDFFGISSADCDPPQVDCPQSPYTSLLDDFAPTLRDPATLDLATEMTSQMMVNDESGQPSSTCCVAALFDSPDVGDPSATPTPASVVTIGAGDVDGVSWYLTTSGKYFRDIHILADSDCLVSVCPAPFEDGEIDDDRITELRDLVATGLLEEGELTEAETAPDAEPSDAGITLGRPRPTSGDCCVSNVYSAVNGINVPFAGAARWVDVASGPHDADPAWYNTTDGLWLPDVVIVADSACRPVNCPTDTPETPVNDKIRRLRDVLDDGELTISTAATVFLEGDSAPCCIASSILDGPGGDVANLITEPTLVTVVGVNDDGMWYQVWLEPVGGGWVHADDFVDFGLCRPTTDTRCPVFSALNEAELLIGLDMTCCVSIGTDAAPDYEAIIFQGVTRTTDDGGTEYQAQDGRWIPEGDFAARLNCVRTSVCPVAASIIDPQGCCITVGAADFDELVLTGERRDIGGGVLEYEASNGQWYLEADFADAGRCGPDTPPCNGQLIGTECCARPNQVVGGSCVPPCPTGQTRIAGGGCQADSQPAPTPTPVPGCANGDDDTHCDNADNCPQTANENQADADNDGRGDSCDPCTDADQDLFCEAPGDVNNDICWGLYNLDQTDSDGDRVGDPCDNCPNTSNADQTDADGDGLGDACECPTNGATGGNGDRDGDGVCDVDDNCVDTPNPGQSDRDDEDGYGDACDNCPDIFNPGQADSYGQPGVGDACECPTPIGASGLSGNTDSDDICNVDDNCDFISNPSQADTDKDGFGNACDNCPSFFNTAQVDTDGDGFGDGCDFCPGANGPQDASRVANPDQGFLYDTTGDGVRDSCFPLLR
nr:hypothetical protein [uncultured bacterium]